MVIAVLAVQGAFVEHEQMLERMNIPYVELRKKDDLFQKYDGIILPDNDVKFIPCHKGRRKFLS